MESLRRVLQRLELKTLALLAAAGGAVWLFLSLADEVTDSETGEIDRLLIMSLRTPGDPADPVGPRWFEEMMRDVTALGGFTFLTLFVVIAAAALAFYRKRRQAAVLAVSIALATLANDALKQVFERARPDVVTHGSYAYTHSFPSGHSTLSAATFLTTAAILSSLQTRRRAKVFIFAIAILVTAAVGFSRVYLGVHWPTDVLGGWTLGAAWALLARLVLGLWRGGAAEAVGEAEPARDG
ncbi:MAG: phosphatase PAP2 family protein [Phenylobacterium sp.]|uniref:phosphatase PAP2 family protein n=1 Tax=Phenylobacterium sp. TaxID=1871053 RepID=UPI002A36E870|nr:phosphatase PAP2 family protein [Phenylobacterium sp.]MDX9996414.1 phosphatase PAP2 family protein [Phenylobacterium sp.]